MLTQPKLWNGGFFESVTLESLGLVINLGHHPNICPVNSDTQQITVIDLSGYHCVRVRFCGLLNIKVCGLSVVHDAQLTFVGSLDIKRSHGAPDNGGI